MPIEKQKTREIAAAFMKYESSSLPTHADSLAGRISQRWKRQLRSVQCVHFLAHVVRVLFMFLPVRHRYMRHLPSPDVFVDVFYERSTKGHPKRFIAAGLSLRPLFGRFPTRATYKGSVLARQFQKGEIVFMGILAHPDVGVKMCVGAMVLRRDTKQLDERSDGRTRMRTRFRTLTRAQPRIRNEERRWCVRNNWYKFFYKPIIPKSTRTKCF